MNSITNYTTTVASYYSVDDSYYSLDRLETLCCPWLPHASIFLETNNTEAIHNILAFCVIFWNKIGPLFNEIIRPFVCDAQNNEIWDVQTFCSAEWMWADKNISFSISNLHLPFGINILKFVNKKVITWLSNQQLISRSAYILWIDWTIYYISNLWFWWVKLALAHWACLSQLLSNEFKERSIYLKAFFSNGKSVWQSCTNTPCCAREIC